MFSRTLKQTTRQVHRKMSHETATFSSCRSITCPALPSSLHLTTPQETSDSVNLPRGSKLMKGRFSHHYTGLQRRFETANRPERVGEMKAEEENAASNAKASNSIWRRTPGSRHLASSTVSQSTASHIPMPCTPRMLITSFPQLNVSDISSRSPTNKSPFSAVLLVGEDDRDEDDPAFALWHTEQLHRARLAKLTRHLGEEIPAELVLSPAFPSNGTSRYSAHSRRGCHHRRSVDPSSFLQGSSTEGVLRRSKSLKDEGGTLRTLSVTGIVPEMPSTKHIAGDVRSVETVSNVISVINSTPRTSATPETWQSSSPTDFLNAVALGGPRDTYADSLPSHSSPSPVEVSGKAFSFFLRASRSPLWPGKLRRRPTTVDGNRRLEKLANFFGVDHDDVSAFPHTRGAAQKFQFPSTSAAGDLAVGIHAPTSQLQVEVKLSKPSRFWNSRTTTETVHPDDVMDELRMMKAS